jgi:membrane protein DedA with SNARE-associated domain
MHFFQTLIDWYLANINLFTIAFLMALESTFLPVPSELVVPPAVWKALDNGEHLPHIVLIVLSGTLGALIGSLINYALGYFLGRRIIYAFANTRLARMCLVTPEKVQKAEQYFIRHGRSSTFIGRLIPGIRHLISIPAGLAKMPVKDFILFTSLGAGMWNMILAILGYFLYTQQDLLGKYSKELSIALLILGVLFVGYLIYQGFRKKDS